MKASRNPLPGVMSRNEGELHATFLEQVKRIPAGDRIKRCIQCGTCTGSCPVSYAMDISPRQLIALFRAGEMEQIMKSRSIWLCASCYACTTRCPSGIKITDLMYALKRTAMEKDIKSLAPQVQALEKAYVKNLMRNGRLHEGTMILNYYLRVNPLRLFTLMPMGWKLWKTKRLAMTPSRIRAHKSLARIIRKAEEIDVRVPEDALGYSPNYVGYRGLGELKLEQRKGASL